MRRTRVAAAALAAFALACASFAYQRRGLELVVVGNVCGPQGNDYCLAPVLKGGFPLPYIYDAPGVSREGALALFEDKFYAAAFALDVVVYLLALRRLGEAWRDRKRHIVVKSSPSADHAPRDHQ